MTGLIDEIKSLIVHLETNFKTASSPITGVLRMLIDEIERLRVENAQMAGKLFKAESDLSKANDEHLNAKDRLLKLEVFAASIRIVAGRLPGVFKREAVKALAALEGRNG